jgi:hypothetical protein
MENTVSTPAPAAQTNSEKLAGSPGNAPEPKPRRPATEILQEQEDRMTPEQKAARAARIAEKKKEPQRPVEAAPRRTLAQARTEIEEELKTLTDRRETLREKSLNINRELHASAMTIESLERLLKKFS